MKRAFLAMLVAVFVAAVFTAASYAGTCQRLTGFPGLVQRVGLVSAGPCAAKIENGCSAANCTTASRKPGKCRNIAAIGPANCACVEVTIGPGLR